MKRRLLIFLMATSVAVFATSCVLWIRSYSAQESMELDWEIVPEQRVVPHWQEQKSIYLWSSQGQFGLYYYRYPNGQASGDSLKGFRVSTDRRKPGSNGFVWRIPQSAWDRFGAHFAFNRHAGLFSDGLFVCITCWSGWIPPIAAALTLCWIYHLRSRVASNGMRCRSCGYDLRATPLRCPECGTVSSNPPT